MIAIVGIGGLGSIVAMFLRKDNIIIIDKDIVDKTNVEHHVLYDDADIGKPKAKVLGEKLGVKYFVGDFREFDFSNVDIIIDCLDSWEERKVLFKIAQEKGKLLIHSAVSSKRFGQIAVIKRSYSYFRKFEGSDHARDESPWVVGSLTAYVAKNYDKFIDKLILINLNSLEINILNLPT